MNVISFSVWGTDPSFLGGAVQNFVEAPHIYPGWRPRIYCRDDVPKIYLDRYAELGAQVIVMPQTLGDWEGLFWRFFPIFDPNVGRTIVRDCDSRINKREAVAVGEWMGTARPLHAMRDHIEHTTVPIMGGMWGCTYWPVLSDLICAWTKFGEKGNDQEFLAAKVWPRMREQALVHDRWPEGTDVDISEKDPLYKVFKYRPTEFHGEHLLLPFPPDAIMDPSYGAHVGDRVL